MHTVRDINEQREVEINPQHVESIEFAGDYWLHAPRYSTRTKITLASGRVIETPGHPDDVKRHLSL